MCRSSKRTNHKTVNQVSDSEDDTAHFLGSINQGFNDHWTATLSVNGHPTVFKLDTGASVSVVCSSEPWLQGQSLQPSKKILCGPGGSILSSSSTVKVKLGYHGRTTRKMVYVLDNQPCLFLSKRACVELGIIKCIDAVAKTSTPDFRGEFQGLFSELGAINTSYKITT